MSNKLTGKLGIQSLRSGLVDDGDDAPLVLLYMDLTLPCRRFLVEHKVAEPGKVSVTAEFLLRLVRAVDGCTEDMVQSFFGYSRREMAFVLKEVEEAAYVYRSDGRLHLTTTGRSLFQPGEEEPMIYDVERKTARAGFDLISMAPAEWQHLSYFERQLPELPLLDPTQASSATKRIPSAFKRFFRDFGPREQPATNARRMLYSVDSVAPDERFSTLVRVRMISTGSKPTSAEIDLSEWRSEYELDDREPVVRSVGEMVERLQVTRRGDDDQAYELLTALAPEYLKEWMKRDGLSVERYYRHAFITKGDIRTDRQTTSLIGSLFTPENARRLFEATSYGLRRVRRTADHFFWVVPTVPLWGSTSILSEVVDNMVERLSNADDSRLQDRPVEPVGLAAGRPDPWVRSAFDNVMESGSLIFPNGFEMFFVPGVVVAAVVHAPVGAQTGLPVPLGLVSFDERVVGRAAELLSGRANVWGFDKRHERSLRHSEALLPQEVTP
ncbi:hypothetical protein K3175_13375 [Qipengyuania sp. GH1]|uniref:hypothetical protein n=1 Tax=Qipengyuania aestuarii TaxID=2867241 RepID=UPI001C87541D|nr:hypothetical protein [Qipengyuania aestuarii]MBX7536652.1 hypothetical protein [Qipengyuania aestuarii]